MCSSDSFADIRNTQQGKQEERLPMFGFVFPSWFQRSYPDIIANMGRNSQRLTTPFDINPTLKNVLHYQGSGKGNIEDRAISLFKQVLALFLTTESYLNTNYNSQLFQAFIYSSMLLIISF